MVTLGMVIMRETTTMGEMQEERQEHQEHNLSLELAPLMPTAHPAVAASTLGNVQDRSWPRSVMEVVDSATRPRMIGLLLHYVAAAAAVALEVKRWQGMVGIIMPEMEATEEEEQEEQEREQPGRSSSPVLVLPTRTVLPDVVGSTQGNVRVL